MSKERKTMSRDSKGALIVIGVAVLITVVIFMVTRERGKEGNQDIAENNTVKEEFINVLEDGTRLNTSTKLHETKTLDGLEISGFQLTEQDNVTVLLGTITNTSNSTRGGFDVTITILDKAGNTLGEIPSYIRSLAPGESTQLNTGITGDYANAYNFTMTKQ